MKADEWHREEISGLMENLSVKDQKASALGTLTGSKLLWSFLKDLMDMDTSNAY